jgi:tetratricopeptide (TPR) repeat protein
MTNPIPPQNESDATATPQLDQSTDSGNGSSQNNTIAIELKTETDLPEIHGYTSASGLQNEIVAITGVLAAMTHAMAAQLITAAGGECTAHISRKTTMLVIGEEGWPLEADGKPSVKLIQAIKQKHQGQHLRIIRESELLNMLELKRPQVEEPTLYTPAMISQSVGVPVHTVRSWMQWGLLLPSSMIYRLPYFSSVELNHAKTLARLMAEGLSRDELCQTVQNVRALLLEVDHASQHELRYVGRSLVLRDDKGLQDVKTRQRLFNFDAPEPTALEVLQDEELNDQEFQHVLLRLHQPEGESSEIVVTDWFIEACRLADADKLSDAIDAFRRSLLQFPHDAECHFYLADVLYRTGKIEAAYERYYTAVEHDPNYLEAWVQVGCLDAMNLMWEKAIHAFERCLQIDPTFPDAHFHLAEVLHELQRDQEAIEHWQLYLDHGARGPWAELARQRLDQFDPLTVVSMGFHESEIDHTTLL